MMVVKTNLRDDLDYLYIRWHIYTYSTMWIKDFKYRIKMYNKLYKRFFKRGVARNHVKIISWAKWTIKQLWDNLYQKLNKVLMRFQGL